MQEQWFRCSDIKGVDMKHQEQVMYGNPPEISYGYGKQSPNNMETASLVMGILAAMTFCCCYVGIAFGSLGILFALLSRNGEPMDGQAKAGVILSGIVVGVSVLIWGIFLALMVAGSGWTVYDPPVQNLPVYPDILVPDNLLKGLWMGGMRI